MPVSASAAHLLAIDALTAGSLKLFELGFKRLADSRDAGISVGGFHQCISPIYYAKSNSLIGKGHKRLYESRSKSTL